MPPLLPHRALLLLSLVGAVCVSGAVPVWSVGAPADRDVVTPIELSVAAPVPAAPASSIFRYDASQADHALEEFDRVVAAARLAWGAAVAARFGEQTVAADQLGDPAFDALYQDWSARWDGLPLKRSVAEDWARGGQGGDDLRRIRDRIQYLMTEWRIRDTLTAPEALQGPAEVRLMADADRGEPLTLQDVAARGRPFRRSQLRSLADARRELREGMPHEDWPTLQFVGQLLRPNTFFEQALTRESRAQPILSADEMLTYPRGTRLVQAGETITPEIHAALLQLRVALSRQRGEGESAIAPFSQKERFGAWWAYGVVLGLIPSALGAAALAAALHFTRSQDHAAPGASANGLR